MIGIGLEEVGVDEFVKGNYFTGDLYIDAKKQCYQDLGYKRLGVFGILGAIFGKKSREANAKAKQEKVDGDFQGDGMQNGGTIVVSSGGKELLLNYKQENVAEHVNLNEVLRVLGIAPSPEVTEAAASMSTDNLACTSREQYGATPK